MPSKKPAVATPAPSTKPSSRPSPGPSSSPTAGPSSSPSASPPPSPQPTTYVDCASLRRFDAGPGANNHLYGRVVRGLSWFEARDAARDLNECCNRTAHLASITSPEEQAFAAVGGGFFPWIGLNNLNQANASNYVWDGTSEAVGYTNWCRAEVCGGVQSPSAGANRCAFLSPAFWADTDCSAESIGEFVVEYDCE
jgi:hypothetical protein